jgi:hypothetical protein
LWWQIAHCQTELTSLRASLEKEILVGDARRKDAASSKKDGGDDAAPGANDPVGA